MPNSSLTTFDEQLLHIDHFRAYPAMLPFVGPDYTAADHRKLLVVAESHYFPEKSTIHADATRWYAGDQAALEQDEIDYINTRGLLACSWASRGHAIYREINRCLDSLPLKYTDRPISTVAYMNAFQRPARTGLSMRLSCQPIDVSRSLDVMRRVIRCLSPDLLVVTSVYSWSVFGAALVADFPDVRMDFVSHPAERRYWNKAGYAHGQPKFINILREHFLTASQ
jgi:hypothetical protein